MSVLFETSLGDLVIDLDTDQCPIICKNFLKLCKVYYYNFCTFYSVQKDFIAQTGDPTNTGEGGESHLALLESTSSSSSIKNKDRFFMPDIHKPPLKHRSKGTVSMAVAENVGCASQFFFTLADDITFLDGKHVPFGRVVLDDGDDDDDEGGESGGIKTLDAINETFVDKNNRPLRDIRIRRVVVLDDPFDDPEGLVIPDKSPVPTKEMLKGTHLRVGEDEDLDGDGDGDDEAAERRRREHDAKSQALTLEMVGDLPFADVRPPENVLFVCKLNQVTRSEDLEMIFHRFGTILSCEVIKDKRTGDSLQYAFIEFDKRADAERAYEKMDNVLIDDRRIHVDFSQSVSKLHSDWVFKRTGGRAPLNKGGGMADRLEKDGSRDEMVFDLDEKDRRHERSRRDGRDDRGGYRRDDNRRYDRRDSHGGRRRSRSPRRR